MLLDQHKHTSRQPSLQGQHARVGSATGAVPRPRLRGHALRMAALVVLKEELKEGFKDLQLKEGLKDLLLEKGFKEQLLRKEGLQQGFKRKRGRKGGQPELLLVHTKTQAQQLLVQES